MLKKEITYEDFDGNSVTKVFYFNLTKAELVELEMSHEGGWQASMMRIVEAKNNSELIREFKKLILDAYGVREGDAFVKTEELRQKFASTAAYSELFMEMVQHTDKAIEFVKGIMPKDMVAGPDVPQFMPPPPAPLTNVTPQQEELGKQIAQDAGFGA